LFGSFAIVLISLLFPDHFSSYQDANVFLSLKGALWDVDSIELDKCLNHTDKFERGSEDIFEFRFPQLGDILSLKIMHDNSGLTNPVRQIFDMLFIHGSNAALVFHYQDWHLAEIEVVDTRMDRSFLFPCNQWLSREAVERQGADTMSDYRFKNETKLS
jgi:hypothetical protein